MQNLISEQFSLEKKKTDTWAVVLGIFFISWGPAT